MVLLRRAFVAAAAAWAAIIFIAPLAAHRPESAVVWLAWAAYSLGHVVCHQLTERSFALLATPLPVCARCTGIYTGAAAAALLVPAFDEPRRRAIFSAVSLVMIAAAIPTAATLIYEWTLHDTPGTWVRAASGLPLGAAIAWIIREVN